MEKEVLRLNLGAGHSSIPGFTPVDRIVGQEVFPLDYPSDSADEIYASHVLEHFSHEEVAAVVAEWVRVLRPGGRIRIAVPDLKWIAEQYLAGAELPIGGFLMGGQTDDNDYHKTVFDEERLRGLMQDAGLTGIQRWTSTLKDCAALPVSLNLEGTKLKSTRLRIPGKLPRIAAVMSMPRLAFADNMFCATGVATELGISFEKITGAFWGQCMERVMTPHLFDGTEYILTVDYDTVFNRDHVLRLLDIMERHPDIDALAPLQVKRDEDQILFKPLLPDGTCDNKIDLDKFNAEEFTRVGWAHFGLTLIRAASLRKLSHPWFLDIPDDKGEWGDGRVDADIHFWNKCKAEGLKACVANHVSVGHLQLLATWPNQNLKPIHQYTTEFQKRGEPTGVRR
jgi:predicted SAM-dependent methyltransferase